MTRSLQALALLVVSLLTACPIADASPIVRWTWGVGPYRWCPPAQANVPVTSGSIWAANATVIGHDAPHRDWRLEFEMVPADGGLFPDAWRVDSLGCAASSGLTMSFVPPPIETCLRDFYDLSSPHFFAPRTSTRFDSASNRIHISVWAGIDPIHVAPDPSYVYLLGTLIFDHRQSVVGMGDGVTTCGGVERPMCIRLVSASYLDPEGGWVAWPVDPSMISANDAISSCAAVKAQTSTWGSMKAQYR